MSVYCGIDVSKGKSDACILDKEKNVIKELTFTHDQEGFEKLENNLSTTSKIGLENTGTYCKPIYFYFKNKGFDITYVDNTKMNYYAKMLHATLKNDSIDAKTIAQYLSLGMEDIEVKAYTELKDISLLYNKLTKENTRYKHMFKSQLATIFPELEKSFSIYHVKNIPLILLEYPTPKSLGEASPEELYAIIKKNNPKSSMGMSFVKRLQEVAKKSIGVEDYPATGFKITIKTMLAYNDLIDETKQQMTALIAKTSYHKLQDLFAYSLIGIATLAGEIGDIRRFSNHKKFIKYCGLDVTEHTSGSSINKKGRISKNGNPRLRWYFNNQCLVHLQKKTEQARFFYRLKNNGKHPKVAMTAMSRKLAVKTYYDMKRCHAPD